MNYILTNVKTQRRFFPLKLNFIFLEQSADDLKKEKEEKKQLLTRQVRGQSH